MHATDYRPQHVAAADFVPNGKRACSRWHHSWDSSRPQSLLLDGISGHAGLFATLADLTIFTRLLAGLPVTNGDQVLPPAAFVLLDRFVKAVGHSAGAVGRKDIINTGTLGLQGHQ